MTRPRVTDVHPPPWTHRTSRTPTGVWHDLVDADGATIYSGPDCGTTVERQRTSVTNL